MTRLLLAFAFAFAFAIAPVIAIAIAVDAAPPADRERTLWSLGSLWIVSVLAGTAAYIGPALWQRASGREASRSGRPTPGQARLSTAAIVGIGVAASILLPRLLPEFLGWDIRIAVPIIGGGLLLPILPSALGRAIATYVETRRRAH